MTFSIFMIILGARYRVHDQRDGPLLFSLNLPEITKDLGILPDLVGFTGSASTLVVAAGVLGVGNVGDVYGLKPADVRVCWQHRL
jgi:hypothetical protein